MAWIEVHQTLSKHRKVIKTAGRLSVDRWSLLGHLLELWWWGLDNVPSDGFMGDISNKEIATAAEWNGDADEFVSALVEAGFIDEDPHGRWLHDWYDYAGKLLVKREKEKERSKSRRSTNQRPTVDQRSDQRSSEESCAAPYPTVPNRTKEREIAVQQITKAYEETFGPLRGEPSQLMTLLDYMDKGMELELINTAIHKSSNAEVPLKYADKILSNQLRKGIKTVKEAIETDASLDATLTVQSGSKSNRNARAPNQHKQSAAKDDRYSNFYELFPEG